MRLSKHRETLEHESIGDLTLADDRDEIIFCEFPFCKGDVRANLEKVGAALRKRKLNKSKRKKKIKGAD